MDDLEKLDDVEVIKTEYMLMSVDIPGSRNEVGSLIDIYVDDMTDVRVRAKRETFRNRVEYNTSLLVSPFMSLFTGENEELSYIDEDLEVIRSQSMLGKKFKGYFKAMRKALSNDNFHDISRLAIFTNKKYLDNYRSLETMRDRTECSSNGFRCFYEGKDTCLAFDKFFWEEFISITRKGLEKTKKI